jgi:hypothetical protein
MVLLIAGSEIPMLNSAPQPPAFYIWHLPATYPLSRNTQTSKLFFSAWYHYSCTFMSILIVFIIITGHGNVNCLAVLQLLVQVDWIGNFSLSFPGARSNIFCLLILNTLEVFTASSSRCSTFQILKEDMNSSGFITQQQGRASCIEAEAQGLFPTCHERVPVDCTRGLWCKWPLSRTSFLVMYWA